MILFLNKLRAATSIIITENIMYYNRRQKLQTAFSSSLS